MEEKPKSKGVLGKMFGLMQEPKSSRSTGREAPSRSSRPAPLSKNPDPVPKPQKPEQDDIDLDFTGMQWSPAPVTDMAALGEMEEEARTNILESAAMRLAEGDWNQACELLLASWKELIAQGAAANAASDTDDVQSVAFALFDFFRATGDRAGFEKIAMEYVENFGRSPAEWFSVVELLERKKKENRSNTASEQKDVPDNNTKADAWVCPGLLDEMAVNALRDNYAGSARLWNIQWSPLKKIDKKSVLAISQLVRFWMTHPLKLQFGSAQALLDALKARTPEGDSSVQKEWWHIRMDVMCILGMQEAFEEVALEYCVIYELSPPSWTQPLCNCEASMPIEVKKKSAKKKDFEGSDFHISEFSANQALRFVQSELIDQVLADDLSALEELRNRSSDAQAVLVDCNLLQRMDFMAAGTLLNWVDECGLRACAVEFANVPNLIAAYFKIIGIGEHSVVNARKH